MKNSPIIPAAGEVAKRECNYLILAEVRCHIVLEFVLYVGMN